MNTETRCSFPNKLMRAACDSVPIVVMLTLAALPIPSHADPMYISDKLVVNVYAEANQESERVATLNSGDAVESLEQIEGYTRVRLSGEREGWIRSTYLVPQPPAIVRLRELERERDAATTTTTTQGPSEDELKKLRDQNSALQKEVTALKQAAEAAAKAAKAAQTSAPTAHSTQQSAQQPAPQDSPPATLGRLEGEAVPQAEPATPWLRYVGGGAAALLAGGALGFVLGFQTLARRIRRKYGSVKIY